MLNPLDIRTYKSFPSFKQKFLSFFPENAFKKGQEDNCWEWQGYKEKSGHGRIRWGGFDYGAHQMSYIIFNGLIPPGNLIRHLCDNPGCVNPKHLLTGNHGDNANDLFRRQSKSSQKLNPEAVKVIKWMLKYKNKRGLAVKLAKLYKVHVATISDIKNNRRWAWVIV